jgi:hypothetical protein
MMKRAASVLSLLVLPLYAATAHADEVASAETTTTQANTVVVVTPSAPVVVTSAAQAAPALQPPGAAEAPPAPAAQPAPQNEPWSNVSHINGQLVKVGERSDYLIQFKRSNISANPFGPFFGYYEGAYTYGLSQNVAISGSIAGYSKSNDYDGHTMFQVTASVPLYFRRTFSGPFIEPGLIYRTSSSSYNSSAAGCVSCTDSSTTKAWVGPELLFGWHWNFDSGLNVSWAFGLAKHASDSNTDPNAYTSSDPDVNGYFRVGYNF